ncbi:hypothetical protein JW930_03190 [Candidatus Woesearchaeota archaeon]|nr:hypothetical protein [Candidatus Woesearchaeota archaeon]
MIKLSELRVVEDAFFNAELEYYKPSFYSFIEENFPEDKAYDKNTLLKLKKIISDSGEKAHDVILNQDLNAIIKSLKSIPKEFDEKTWRDFLPEIREEVKKVLGLDFKPRSVFFEDRFPQGLFIFEKKGASSVTIFEGQKNAGIYFLNKRVSSFFTPILLIHEQLHSCLSQNKTKEQTYIEWFEEGLCQWYSVLIYFNLTKNNNVIELYKQRNYIYSRVKPEYNFTKRYYEYMKIFQTIYLHGGPELIGKILFEYLSDKRDRVNEFLNMGALDVKYQPTNEIESRLVRFTLFIEPEKVTPLEYLILRLTKKPKTVKTLSMMINAPEDVIKKTLVRLQLKGMIVFKDKFVEINWRKQDLLEHDLVKPIYPF